MDATRLIRIASAAFRRAVSALLAPWLCSASPWEMLARLLIMPFSDAGHWLGTDVLGRNIATGGVPDGYWAARGRMASPRACVGR